MTRQTVLLLFGGESPEHDVSIMSARNIYAAMDNEKYLVLPCYIDRQGKWWLLDKWEENATTHHSGVQLVAALGNKAFLTLPGNRMIHPDVIYPAMHGDTAEDGSIQALADLLHLPVVGSGHIAHAVGWDKLFTKLLLEQADIQTVPFLIYKKSENTLTYHELCDQLATTKLFVKPTRAGSSIGVSKVESQDQLIGALELALRYCDTVLIEKAIIGRELEVAILGNPPHHRASNVGEIRPKDGFYDYEEKYASTSQTEVLTQAELEQEVGDAVKTIAKNVFTTLGCKGQARVDFFLGDEGEIYVNEINTLPGFTNISQYPKLWHDQGIRYPELIDMLISLALK